MISKVIYFVDGWVKTNVNDRTCGLGAESLARRCIADAAKAGFTHDEVERELGTDLIDFLSSELQAYPLATGLAASPAANLSL